MTNHDSPCALKIDLSTECREMLVELKHTGLFGESIEDIADLLIRERLRELEVEGWCGDNVSKRRRFRG